MLHNAKYSNPHSITTVYYAKVIICAISMHVAKPITTICTMRDKSQNIDMQDKIHILIFIKILGHMPRGISEYFLLIQCLLISS